MLLGCPVRAAARVNCRCSADTAAARLRRIFGADVATPLIEFDAAAGADAAGSGAVLIVAHAMKCRSASLVEVLYQTRGGSRSVREPHGGPADRCVPASAAVARQNARGGVAVVGLSWTCRPGHLAGTQRRPRRSRRRRGSKRGRSLVRNPPRSGPTPYPPRVRFRAGHGTHNAWGRFEPRRGRPVGV